MSLSYLRCHFMHWWSFIDTNPVFFIWLADTIAAKINIQTSKNKRNDPSGCTVGKKLACPSTNMQSIPLAGFLSKHQLFGYFEKYHQVWCWKALQTGQLIRKPLSLLLFCLRVLLFKKGPATAKRLVHHQIFDGLQVETLEETVVFTTQPWEVYV